MALFPLQRKKSFAIRQRLLNEWQKIRLSFSEILTIPTYLTLSCISTGGCITTSFTAVVRARLQRVPKLNHPTGKQRANTCLNMQSSTSTHHCSRILRACFVNRFADLFGLLLVPQGIMRMTTAGLTSWRRWVIQMWNRFVLSQSGSCPTPQTSRTLDRYPRHTISMCAYMYAFTWLSNIPCYLLSV